MKRLREEKNDGPDDRFGMEGGGSEKEARLFLSSEPGTPEGAGRLWPTR